MNKPIEPMHLMELFDQKIDDQCNAALIDFSAGLFVSDVVRDTHPEEYAKALLKFLDRQCEGGILFFYKNEYYYEDPTPMDYRPSMQRAADVLAADERGGSNP